MHAYVQCVSVVKAKYQIVQTKAEAGVDGMHYMYHSINTNPI